MKCLQVQRDRIVKRCLISISRLTRKLRMPGLTLHLINLRSFERIGMSAMKENMAQVLID